MHLHMCVLHCLLVCEAVYDFVHPVHSDHIITTCQTRPHNAVTVNFQYKHTEENHMYKQSLESLLPALSCGTLIFISKNYMGTIA